MLCKVCKEAGKSKKKYTNHNTKDTKGNIIYPYILNLHSDDTDMQGKPDIKKIKLIRNDDDIDDLF